MRYLSSLITVSDMKTSRHFYENLLGQKVSADHGQDLAFEGGFALHEREHFQELTGLPVPENNRSHCFELYFETDRPEETEQSLKTAEVEFIHPVVEQPWRQKVLRCYDPDGTIVEIGESMKSLSARLYHEGMALDAISAMLKLPLEFVKESAGQ